MKKLFSVLAAVVLACGVTAQPTPSGGAAPATQTEVNAGQIANKYVSPKTLNSFTGFASVWGTITGTLSNQSDLQAALNAKIGGTNPTLIGYTLTGAAVISYTPMPALAINVAKPGNTYSAVGNVTFTFSNDTPTPGTRTLVKITADSSARTINIPTTWSLARSGFINSVVVPASGTLLIQFEWTGTRWESVGDPVATSGSGSFVLASSPTIITPTIAAILSGGFTNTLPTATGTLLSTAATITVAQGGSGLATTTAYGPIFTGTTATGAWKADTGPGTINYVMTSNGAGQYPTWQVTQAAGSGTPIPTATTGKFALWRYNGNALSIVSDANQNGGPGTLLGIAPTATDGMAAQYTCAATTATLVGVYGYSHWRVGRSLYYAGSFKLVQTTNERLWLGFTDQSAFNQAASATPSGNYAMFRYDTGVSANWFACTRDGTTLSTTDTTIAADTSFHKFEVVSNDGTPNIVFKIDGTTVATKASNLPTSGTNLQQMTLGQTLANEAKAIQIEYIYTTATK